MSDSSLTLSTVGTDSADSDTVAPSIRKKTNPVKTAAVVMLLCAIFGGLPALEDHFGRGTSAWEPKAAPRFPLALPPLFGLVVLVNIVGASLVLIFKLVTVVFAMLVLIRLRHIQAQHHPGLGQDPET